MPCRFAPGVEYFPNHDPSMAPALDPSQNPVISADGGMTGVTIMGMAAGAIETGLTKDVKRVVGVSSGASGMPAMISEAAATDGRNTYVEDLSGAQFINHLGGGSKANLRYLEH